jgi:hypothetical protein
VTHSFALLLAGMEGSEFEQAFYQRYPQFKNGDLMKSAAGIWYPAQLYDVVHSCRDLGLGKGPHDNRQPPPPGGGGLGIA